MKEMDRKNMKEQRAANTTNICQHVCSSFKKVSFLAILLPLRDQLGSKLQCNAKHHDDLWSARTWRTIMNQKKQSRMRYDEMRMWSMWTTWMMLKMRNEEKEENQEDEENARKHLSENRRWCWWWGEDWCCNWFVSNIIEYQHCKKNCQQIQQMQRNKTMLTLRSSAPLRYPGWGTGRPLLQSPQRCGPVAGSKRWE